MKNTTSARLFFTILLISTLFFISARGIINNRITRAFDMDGPNSKQVTLIEFTNDSNEDIETYTLLVNSNHFNNLVYIEAKMNDEKLEVKRSIVDDVLSPHHSSYKVKFKNPISRGSKGKMIVLELYKNRKLPFPRTMKLTDIPKVRLIDNAYYPSMYPTEKMKSTFELGTTSILIKATEDGIGEVRGRSVRYGTFKDVAPLKSHQIVVYMSYDEPLPIFTSMTRSVFLSHWGPD